MRTSSILGKLILQADSPNCPVDQLIQLDPELFLDLSAAVVVARELACDCLKLEAVSHPEASHDPVGGGVFNREEALHKWKQLFTTFVTLFEFC